MNHHPISTSRNPNNSTHHTPSDIQKYQQAKKLAFELSEQAELLRHLNAFVQLRMRIDEINNKISGINTELKGQVILLCCSNIIETSKRRFQEYFTSNYWKDIQNYLVSLSSQKKEEQNKSKYSINDTYKGKLKKNSINIEKKKRNILDLLFIDRVDRVLKQIYSEIENNCSQSLSKILTKSLVMAERVLPIQQAIQYKENITEILNKKSYKDHQQYKSQSAQGRYIIIDQSFSIQKNKPFKLKRQSSSNISSTLKYYLTKQFSIANSIDSSRKNQQQCQGKIPVIHRSSKRGSISSNYSKRSSTYNGKSEQRVPRGSVRWNNKASIEIITNSYNRARPLRKSNFLTIRQKQGELDLKQDSFLLKASNSIIEEDVQQQKVFDSTLKELFVNGLKSMRKMREFYVTFYIKGKVFLAIAEENKEYCIFSNQNRDDKEDINIKIRIINQKKDLLFLTFRSEEFNRTSKQQSCLKLINAKAQFCINLLNNIKVRINDINYNIEENEQQQKFQNTLFKIDSLDQICLIGFIRKISTHFICICRFNKKEIQQYNCTKWIRKMLQTNSRFPKQILAQNQLKNADLTMDFRLQQPKNYKTGSVIAYTQDEQSQQQFNPQQQNYHQKLQTNTIKQHIQITIKTIFTNRQTPQTKTHRLRRKIYNSRFGKLDQKQTESRKIKRTILNKNSIKLLNHMKEADLIMLEAEASRTFQNKFFNKSQIDRVIDKRLSNQSLADKRTAKRRIKNQRQFIETVKTDRGYELVMHRRQQRIQGFAYQSYLGYSQRNPKRTCYSKKMKELDFVNVQNCSKPGLSIHGKATKEIQNTTLITFLKTIKIEDAFGGHAITTIKLLSNNPNSQIFIQTYWQSRQKYYIFIITSELFQKFTDINTRCFFQQPFLQHIEQPSKKKDRRTSVMASIIKQKDLDPQSQHSNNSKKLRHRTFDSFHEVNQQNQSNFGGVRATPKKNQNHRTATIGQWQTMNRGIKTMDTCSTSKMMKISGKNQIYALKKQIVSKIKSKFVKHIFFTWKNFKLYLNIKSNSPTNLQSDPISIFQGSQIAIKNVYSKPQSPKQLQATQLILIRYFQNSLANLNFFTLQGLNKVYLQHLFIKNSTDLYGRYSAFVSLRDLIEQSKFNLNYKHNNSFFCTSENKLRRHSTKDIKTIFSKTSSFQDQKKLKYQQILNLSKRCSINISDIQQKKKILRRKQFIISNKYPNFQPTQLLFKVEIRQQQILIKNLHDEQKLTIDLYSLYKLIPYASQLHPIKLKKLIIERILKDEDIIKLTTVFHQ